MSITPWKVANRTNNPFEKNDDNLIEVFQHPLLDIKQERLFQKSAQVKPEIEKQSNYEFIDPLGATNDENSDFIRSQIEDEKNKERSCALDNTLESQLIYLNEKIDVVLPDFQSWSQKRAEIQALSKTSQTKLTRVEALQLKLKELQYSGTENSRLVEFPKRIGAFRDALINAWNNNQRVESFRIISDASRLLQSAAAEIDDFPQNWLLTIDVLDLFGRFVYDRLLMKANEERRKSGQKDMPKNFNSDHVPPQTKEMAKHWFLKVSELTELIVRFYVESALISCLRFLDSSSVRVNLERLSTMCSNFPQDLSSLYARAYICRVAMQIECVDRAPHWRCLHDFMQSRGRTDVMLMTTKLNSAYSIKLRKLSQPAMDWIVQCVSYGIHAVEDLEPLWLYCKKDPPDERSIILVNACINALPSAIISVYSRELLELASSIDNHFAEPLESLGRRLIETSPVEEHRLDIKKNAWKKIANIYDNEPFLKCTIQWVAYTARYFNYEHVSELIQIVLNYLNEKKMNENELSDKQLYVQLIESFLNYFKSPTDILKVLGDSGFAKILDFIGNDREAGAKCAEAILMSINKTFKRSSIDNYLVSLMIIDQSSVVCGNRNWNIIGDEVRIAEKLVVKVLTRIDLKSRDDKMNSIDLVTRARACLGLRQIVLEQIINILVDFTMDCYISMKNGSKKSEILRICITNLSLTIPSVHDVKNRFIFSLKVIQLGMFANFLPLIDSTCRRCIETLDEMIESNKMLEISQFVAQFLAILVRVPDAPEKGKPLYFFGKLMVFFEKNEEKIRKEAKGVHLAEMYINSLKYLAAMRKLEGMNAMTRANDVLYGGDEEFSNFVESKIDEVVGILLTMADEPLIAVMILENFIRLFEITEDIRSTIRGLLKRASVDRKYAKRLEWAIEDLRLLAKDNENVMKLLEKLSLV